MKYTSRFAITCILFFSQISLSEELFRDRYLYEIINPPQDSLDAISASRQFLRTDFKIDELQDLCKSLHQETSGFKILNIQDICKDNEKLAWLVSKIEISTDEKNQNRLLYPAGLTAEEYQMMKQIRYQKNKGFYWAANIFIDRSQRILNPFATDTDDRVLRSTIGVGKTIESNHSAWEISFPKGDNSLKPGGIMFLMIRKF